MDARPLDVAVNSPDHDAPAFGLHPSPPFALFPEHFIQEHFDHLFRRARFPHFKVSAKDRLTVQRPFRATAPRRLILTREPSPAFRDVCAPHYSASDLPSLTRYLVPLSRYFFTCFSFRCFTVISRYFSPILVIFERPKISSFIKFLLSQILGFLRFSPELKKD
jgi:hypothetical protein